MWKRVSSGCVRQLEAEHVNKYITQVHFATWHHCQFVKLVRRLCRAAVALWCRWHHKVPENEKDERLSSILIPEETFIFVKKTDFLPTLPSLPVAWMILNVIEH